MRPARAISGHVFRVDLKRRSVWRAKYRLPDGRQVQRTIGRVWTERGRPPEGYFTKRTAQAWLRDVLDQAERGVLPGMVRTGRTFADAAEEYLRYLADDRQRKPSTVRDARSVIRNHLLPRFGERPLEDITEQDVERWASRLGADRPLSNATKRKVIVIFHGVMERACLVYRLPMNPVGTVEKPRLAAPGAIDVFSPEEVHALVRAAASEQDAAIFLTAAFTACARASSSRCAGVTSISPARTSASLRVTPTASYRRRRAEGCDRCRWRLRSPRRWRGSSSGSGSSGRTTSSSSGWSAVTSTRRRCCAATAPRCGPPACGRCASTICATRSARG
jgi:hypothetical protein